MTSKIRKPKVDTNCVADKYSAPSEKIIEFAFPDGSGGLICFFSGVNENRIDIYRIDNNVLVVVENRIVSKKVD